MYNKCVMKWSCAGGVLALLVVTISASGSIDTASGHRPDADRGQAKATPAAQQSGSVQSGELQRSVSGGGMGACCISSRVPCASDADCIAAGGSTCDLDTLECDVDMVTCSDGTQADCTAAGGTYQGDGTMCLGDNDGDGIDDACCPATDCVGVDCTVGQSINIDLDGANQVACESGGNQTTSNAWSRCYTRADEGFDIFDPLTINSVTFGVQQADLDFDGDGIGLTEIPLDIVIYTALNGCPATDVGPTDAVELCRTSTVVTPADVSTPVACTSDQDCINAGGTTCAAHVACTSDQDCINAGGTTCDLGTGECINDPRECTDVATIIPITVDFMGIGPDLPAVAPGRDWIVEVISPADGTDPLNDFAFRAVANAKGECAESYIRSPDGDCSLVGFSTLESIGFPDSHLYLQLDLTIGGTAAFCGNTIIEGCEQCDPPDGLPAGSSLCNDQCRSVVCGDALAGACCGDDVNNTAYCDDDDCCNEVCDIDPFCCGEGGGTWDSECANLAVSTCADSGEICEVTTRIATGDNDSIDGYLAIAADAYGSWATGGFSGQGDGYNPVGATPPLTDVTFTNGFWMFVGTAERELLSFNDEWQAVFPQDDTLDREILAEPVLEDTNMDGVEDRSTSQFRVFASEGVTDVTFDVENQVEVLGNGASLLTQIYTITNNAEEAIEFELLRGWDLDLLWDPGEAFDNDSVGTLANGCGLGTFVYQGEEGQPETNLTMSTDAPGAQYYGSRGGLRPEAFTLDGGQEVPPVATAGSGTATAILDTTTLELSWNISYEGLSSDAIAAHLHGPGFPGENADVQIDLGPVSGTSGTIIGSAIVDDAQATDIDDGAWYANIHTAPNPGGEIRGQLGPEYAFGTDLQEWDARGLPNGWRNHIAGVGYDTNGQIFADPTTIPECDPCDGKVGIGIPISLGAAPPFAGGGGNTTTLTMKYTYGANTPEGQECSAAPTGACCVVAECTPDLSAADCTTQGGLYQGDDSACDPNPCAACGPCPDFDDDNDVDAADLAQLLGAWGDPGCSGMVPCCPDRDGDGDVDAGDLAVLLGAWGPCP